MEATKQSQEMKQEVVDLDHIKPDDEENNELFPEGRDLRQSILEYAEGNRDPMKKEREKTLHNLMSQLDLDQYQLPDEDEEESSPFKIPTVEPDDFTTKSYHKEKTEERKGPQAPEEDCNVVDDGDDNVNERHLPEEKPKITVPNMTEITNSHMNHDKRVSRPMPSTKPVEKKLPEMTGWLYKRNPYGLWENRFIVLKNRKLMYYGSQDLVKLLGCLNFDTLEYTYEIVDDADKSKIFKITPAHAKKLFTFKAMNREEMIRWYEACKLHIDASKGAKLQLRELGLIPYYWKNDRITEEEFKEQADTGDILLFQSDNFASKLQRGFTGSQYDHVAMLLRYNNGDIVLLEATGRIGVGLCTWKHFRKMKWHYLYNKLVYRPLRYRRNEDMINQLEHFIRSTLGKKYKVSASKLLKTNSLEDTITDDRTFFCSELVAAAYKYLKLLPAEVSACNYWPAAFSTEKNMGLLQGASLGPEQLIDMPAMPRK